MLEVKQEGLKYTAGIQSKHFFQPEDGDSISEALTSLSHLKSTLKQKIIKTTTNDEKLTNYKNTNRDSLS